MQITLSPTVTLEQRDLVKRTVFPDATPDELQMYFHFCQQKGVHPLDKLIVPIKFKGRCSFIATIDYMRQRAESSGCYAGSDDAVFSGKAKESGWSATVTVWKMVGGQRCSFSATARWEEYRAGGPMWDKMPATMLAKCSEGLALRKAFPGQLTGLYAPEEMDQANNPKKPVNVLRVDAKPAQLESYDPETGEVHDTKGETSTKLRDHYLDKIKDAVEDSNHARLRIISADIVRDKQAGLFADADLDDLRRAREAAAAVLRKEDANDQR